MILAVGNDGQFQRFCKVVGLDHLAIDPDFSTNPARVTNRARLREIIVATLADWDRDVLLAGPRKRPPCPQAPSTTSRKCSPTRRWSRAACAWISTTATATPCPVGARADADVGDAAGLSARLAEAWRTHDRKSWPNWTREEE